jgi:hypothetical protein
MAFLLCWAATGALAQEMTSSPRPPVKPANAAAVAGTGTAAAPAPEAVDPEAAPEAATPVAATGDIPHPKARPATLAIAVSAPAAAAEVTEEVADAPAALPDGALASSLRPEPRPKKLVERIAALKASAPAGGLDLSSTPGGKEVDLAAVQPPTAKERRQKKRAAASMQGSVCGVPGIKGEEIKRITSKVKGCGVEDPVAVTSIAGVRLTQTATVDCSIASAL